MSVSFGAWSRTRDAFRRSDWTCLISVEKDLEEASREGRVERSEESEVENVSMEDVREDVEE